MDRGNFELNSSFVSLWVWGRDGVVRGKIYLIWWDGTSFDWRIKVIWGRWLRDWRWEKMIFFRLTGFVFFISGDLVFTFFSLHRNLLSCRGVCFWDDWLIDCVVRNAWRVIVTPLPVLLLGICPTLPMSMLFALLCPAMCWDAIKAETI